MSHLYKIVYVDKEARPEKKDLQHQMRISLAMYYEIKGLELGLSNENFKKDVLREISRDLFGNENSSDLERIIEIHRVEYIGFQI